MTIYQDIEEDEEDEIFQEYMEEIYQDIAGEDLQEREYSDGLVAKAWQRTGGNIIQLAGLTNNELDRLICGYEKPDRIDWQQEGF